MKIEITDKIIEDLVDIAAKIFMHDTPWNGDEEDLKINNDPQITEAVLANRKHVRDELNLYFKRSKK